MSVVLNETHDPTLQSWVASANAPDTDFPVQNLAFGVFRRAGAPEGFRVGVAIGDQILDLGAALRSGVFVHQPAPALKAAQACDSHTLNALMALGSSHWSALRLALSRLLRTGAAEQAVLQACLQPQDQAVYAVPAQIGDYTDFYTSIHHATNVGKLFRPDNPLLPNYQWVPIGYHGRSSSIGVSGQAFHRPLGQTLPPGASSPVFGPSKRLDYELELGVFIGNGNPLGEPIALDAAEDHVFGLCLFNDWSARDLQGWEYQPLGPFLSKNFASTVSPWVVTLEALAPYRRAWVRPADHPQPLPYLDSTTLRREGALDIELEVLLQTAVMRAQGQPAQRISRSNFHHAYWSVSQMVAHHTVNGCNLQPGDLLGSGTQSGPNPEEAGALIELTVGGKQPLTLANGETRTFLEDHDTVVFRAHCAKEGAARIGFGEVSGTVLPARASVGA
ncbi:fumarylacetoacetase [Curvibacter sp. APW13]|uniref:fumarylacetoacetase n=1 Tax=Curvibacter sp. APW13 TaxID=3077236 RepID=UPI0028DE16BC|nr:fumarylacetoacetase [Curvibacter sp. APW13]MDT8992366.1 fumarylacetoacetase [Curvibacter sp. APW13]